MPEMVHVHVTFPRDVYDNLKTISSSRGESMRSIIRQTLRYRIESELTGQKRCSTGEACFMSFMPGIKPISSAK